MGLLSEDYFLNYDEADWCYRASAQGMSHYFVPAAVVAHKGAVSFQGTEGPLYRYFIVRNRLLLRVVILADADCGSHGGPRRQNQVNIIPDRSASAAAIFATDVAALRSGLRCGTMACPGSATAHPLCGTSTAGIRQPSPIVGVMCAEQSPPTTAQNVNKRP